MVLPDIDSLGDLGGKRVLVRASLNVPVKDGTVENDFRLARLLPTLNLLRERGAKIILMGHIGREPHESLLPVCAFLQKHYSVICGSDVVGDEIRRHAEEMHEGDILLLQNTRSHPGEVTNDVAFARELASLGECYINDAFSDSHRAHASVVGVPALLPHAAGLNLLSEVEQLMPALAPQAPSLFILAGAKFETKQPLVEKFLNSYDRVFVGGALANDFFKARGYEVGRSLVSAAELHIETLLNHPKLILPRDVTVQGPQGVRVIPPDEVASDERILDAGPETIEELRRYIAEAKSVLWNGPLGNYESGFSEQTEALVRILEDADAQAIVGGGDTIASIAKHNVFDKFHFVSTGGGAMLEFLLAGTLPGIEALKQ